MTFQECLGFSPFEIIWQRMYVLYPEEKGAKEAYEQVYNDLLSIEPVKTDMRIRVDFVEEEDKDFSHWEIYGVNNARHQDIPKEEGGVDADHEAADRLVHYAIEFRPRSEWAGMMIDSATVCEMATIDIAIHCLWEMTFMGFEEDSVQRELDVLKERSEAVKNKNMDDYVEVREGVMCHKDMVERMQAIFDFAEGEDTEKK